MKEKYVTRSIRVESELGQGKKKTILGVEMGDAPTVIIPELCSISDLSNKIAETCNGLDLDGYEVISITPIIRGDWDIGGNGAYGYSVADGVIITAKLMS